MQTDAVIQTIIKALPNLKWKEYEGNDQLQWYYAENNFYIVKDVTSNCYWFISAKSPSNACTTVMNRKEKAWKKPS